MRFSVLPICDGVMIDEQPILLSGGCWHSNLNIGCPSIMTPSKIGKTKNHIFYSDSCYFCILSLTSIHFLDACKIIVQFTYFNPIESSFYKQSILQAWSARASTSRTDPDWYNISLATVTNAEWLVLFCAACDWLLPAGKRGQLVCVVCKRKFPLDYKNQMSPYQLM